MAEGLRLTSSREDPGQPAEADVPPRAGASSAPRVSVIVPSFNSRWTIKNTLSSLRVQKSPPPFEVLVVDSSTDGTGDLIAAEFPEVGLHRMPFRTYQSRARNLGARAARGDILAFTDADCVADPHWIRRIVTAFDGDGVQAIGGLLSNANPASAVSRAMFVLQFQMYLIQGGRQPVDNLPANNIAYQRDLFLEMGGYPEKMGSSEETLLHFLFKEQGVTLWFDPSIRVAHFNLEKVRPYLRHQVKQGRFYRIARLQAKLPGSKMLNRLWATPFFPLVRFYRALPVLRREVPSFRLRVKTLLPLLGGLVTYSCGEMLGHWRPQDHTEAADPRKLP